MEGRFKGRKTCELGARYGLLVVLRKIDPQPHQNQLNHYYELQCDCGNRTTSDAYQLANGRRVSCGCRKGKFWNGRMSKGWSTGHDYKSLKAGAKKRKIPFKITLDEFEAAISNPCVYCGDTEIKSLDRIENAYGYQVGNVQACCTRCNLMKHTMTTEGFVKHVRKIVDNLARL
jgi:hypothetical protein